ncbi:hypothetical protein PCANC_09751 [Puccinia coronata f. sp. avenae]|uniref:Uncharacterized protein n=1 Tax=Puccinia coronata f. sp. avenae TaxID=200324 RepID=A0A2N5VT45_9BASI|nr:hypothetical protein PCANC_09751 [Puccinia coronata f. sp. avenae]
MLESGQSLTPEDFHCQWHLNYNPEATPKNNKQPENNIEEEISKLILNLCKNDPNKISNTTQQFKLIAVGTHMAVPIQEPDNKQQKKG